MKAKILTLLCCVQMWAQSSYPKDYFRSPMDIPLYLSGNFGELRTNHFHAGLDIRTQQKEGLNIYAVADGYVSRIRISAYGYGKAIYVDHPNGYTSVYGHLQGGSPRLEAYIKQKHYEKKSFDLDIFPKPDELPVKKGEIIALSGNTGGSEGPHLHFEFRDTKTEKIINPMHFGFDLMIPDKKKPELTTILAYPISPGSKVNGSFQPIAISLTKLPDGNYQADPLRAYGKIGFGFSGFDQQEQFSGKNGIYSIATTVNGKSSYSYTFDRFGFDETRFINALIDYPRYKKNGGRVQKLFQKNALNFDLFQTDTNLGQIEAVANLTQNYKIELGDFHQNKISIQIPIVYSEEGPAEPLGAKTGYRILAHKDAVLEKNGASITIKANTFYEDQFIDFDFNGKELTFGDESIPAHTNYTVSITDESYPEPLRDKVFIATANNNKLTFNGTRRKASTYTTNVRVLGKFRLALDTIAPKIAMTKKIEGQWISKEKAITATISDNLSGIKSFNGYLNGNWILFEFDYKTRRITHRFDWDDFLVDGRNELKIEATDNVGNSAIFETHFFRSKTP